VNKKSLYHRKGVTLAIEREKDADYSEKAKRKEIVSSDKLPVLYGSMYLKWTDKKGFGIFLGNDFIEEGDIVATYGGVVVPYTEANDRTKCYSLYKLKLKSFPFRDKNPGAICDGSSVWSGDGKFINTSCCPMAITSHTLGAYNKIKKTKKARTGDKVLTFKLE